MELVVRLEPTDAAPPAVDFRWDADTDILTATLRAGAVSEGMSGSLEVEGSDGSWVMFDVDGGRIAGIEVAVWPEVRKNPTLTAPADIKDARVSLPTRRSQPGIAALEMNTRTLCEADDSERIIHFRFGAARATSPVRVAKDVLLEIDERSCIAGLWFLNVPPFPNEK